MLVAAKTYALISEYALICDMRLITREYGIADILCGHCIRSFLYPAIECIYPLVFVACNTRFFLQHRIWKLPIEYCQKQGSCMYTVLMVQVDRSRIYTDYFGYYWQYYCIMIV